MKVNSIEISRIRALWSVLANDTKLSRFVTDADRVLFNKRIEAEGLTFVTVTLPALGKCLDASFEQGRLEIPEGWSNAVNATYPAFLSRAWETLFHSEGSPRWHVAGEGQRDIPMLNFEHEEQGAAVQCIRQLTMAFYKYEQPWTPQQEAATFEAFKTAEDELWAVTSGIISRGTNSIFIDGISLRTYLSRAEMLIDRLLRGVEPDQFHPQYGTGATADKASPWGRWENPRFIRKLDEEFPYNEWFFSGINGLEANLFANRLDLLEVDDPCARVVLVPKDSRGPRLISAEPREFMYHQQRFFKAMCWAVERFTNVRAQVDIKDQARNRTLIAWASLTGSHAGLDLTEASDRVSWWLVTRLFPEKWVSAFDACRSESTVLPSGEEIPLTKYAPMGSACCFPVESIVFWALCNAARKDWSDRRTNDLFASPLDIERLLTGEKPPWVIQDVCVFGDDIIVPVDHVDRTIALLEAVGLKINRSKSFTRGPFRESCGADCYCGIDVTPVRVKHLLRGDGIDVVFRFKDVCNRISLIYGETSPNICLKLRELFQEFFGFKPPLLPNTGSDGSSGLVLYDYHWNQREPGMTLRKDKQKGGFKVIRALQSKDDRGEVKRPRKGSNDGCKADPSSPCTAVLGLNPQPLPYYSRSEIRVLTEIAVEATKDLGWSSVLRSFCINGGRGGTDKYSFRKRVHHKLAWIAE